MTQETQIHTIAKAFSIIEVLLKEGLEVTYLRLSEELMIPSLLAQRLLASYTNETGCGCTFLVAVRQAPEFIKYHLVNPNQLEDLLNSMPLDRIESICVVSVWQREEQDPCSLWRSEMQYALSHLRDPMTDQPIWIPKYVTYTWALSATELVRGKPTTYHKSTSRSVGDRKLSPTRLFRDTESQTSTTLIRIPQQDGSTPEFPSSSRGPGSSPSSSSIPPVAVKRVVAKGRCFPSSIQCTWNNLIPSTSRKSSDLKNSPLHEYPSKNDSVLLVGRKKKADSLETHSGTLKHKRTPAHPSTENLKTNRLTDFVAHNDPSQSDDITDNNEEMMLLPRRKKPRLFSDDESDGESEKIKGERNQTRKDKASLEDKLLDMCTSRPSEEKENIKVSLDMDDHHNLHDGISDRRKQKPNSALDTSDSQHSQIIENIEAANIEATALPRCTAKVKVKAQKLTKKGKYTVIDTVEEFEEVIRPISDRVPEEPNGSRPETIMSSKHQSSLLHFFKK